MGVCGGVYLETDSDFAPEKLQQEGYYGMGHMAVPWHKDDGMLLCVAVCCSVLQYVAVCCSMVQCVAVCIS